MAESSHKPKFVFDFEKLKETFCQICPDFAREPNYMSPTSSRRFAEQIIFDFSKEAKKAKKEKRNNTWVIKFKNTTNYFKIHVTAYNTKPPPQCQPAIINNCLAITFKQASLLAVAKYCQVVPHQVKRNQIVFTPLAGAVFQKNHLPELAKALDEPLDKLVMSINSSSQTDGYYLDYSCCHIALVVLMKTVTDCSMRNSLLKKTLKMYKLYGKNLDLNKFKIISEFLAETNVSPQDRSLDAIDDEVEQLLSQILTMQTTKTNENND